MLFHNKVSAWHLFLLLTIFWMSWLYAAYIHRGENTEFRKSVESFMERGNRFTSEDGKNLEAKIEKLQARLDSLADLEEREHGKLREQNEQPTN